MEPSYPRVIDLAFDAHMSLMDQNWEKKEPNHTGEGKLPSDPPPAEYSAQVPQRLNDLNPLSGNKEEHNGI